MKPMRTTLGGFRAALLIGWLALSAAGFLYARGEGIPAWAALPVVAAFLIEYSFYLVPGFSAARDRLAQFPTSQLLLFLVASVLLPYLFYASGTGQFRWTALVQLAALAIAMSLWYYVLPSSPWTDFAYLALVATVLLSKYFDPIYTPPVAGLHVEILGHLALFHLSATVMLVVRRVSGTGFGFLPNRAEWMIGLRQFLYVLVLAFPLALALKLIRLGPSNFSMWKLAGTFAGMLWVVALSEEFLARGLLQQWIEEWTGSALTGLVAASVVFGAVHLGFRGFPNWKFALVAALAGWFYGRAYQQARSIRASMVTHALVVTAWRVVFS
jgi:membrane protease YdiL (CAAX protease family)